MNKKSIYAIAILPLLLVGCGEQANNTVTTNPTTNTQVATTQDPLTKLKLEYSLDLSKYKTTEYQAQIDKTIQLLNERVAQFKDVTAKIYSQNTNNETHIIIELDNVKTSELDNIKALLNRNIIFTVREKNEKMNPNYAADAKKKAEEILAKVKTGDFKTIGREEAKNNPDQISFAETKYVSANQMATNLAAEVFKTEAGKVVDKVIENEGEYSVGSDGKPVQQTGYSIIKVVDRKQEEEEIKTPRSVKVAHILIAYKGALRADPKNTKTEDEAKKIADEVLAKAQKGDKFEDLAKQYSDDTSNKDKGGVLDLPVTGKGDYVKEFEDGSMKFTKVGDIAIVKTDFGFHIIKALEIKEAKDGKEMIDKAQVQRIYISGSELPWTASEISNKQFVRAEKALNTDKTYFINLYLSEEGAKMLEELTARNINKQIAIFVNKQILSAPTVQEKISGGKAVISGNFSSEQADQLIEILNTGILPAPLTLVSP